MAESETVLVVPAAGRGQRLGGVAKAALRLGDGRSFLEHIWATAVAHGVARGVVIAGPPHQAEVLALATPLGLEVVQNPEPERGMASSIELGFAWAARRGAAAALLWPCDHPRVAPSTLVALSRALAGAPALDGAVPTWRGRGGHPALLRRSLFPALARCQGADHGARSVLRAAQMARVEVDDDGCVRDVDLPADVAALAESS